MPTQHAILDTSSLFGKELRKELIMFCAEGLLVGYWSPHIIGELYRNLTIDWLKKNGFTKQSLSKLSAASKRMMDIMSTVLELADTVPTDGEEPIVFRDPDDKHLIRAARLVGAAFVISENTKDFPAADASERHMFGEIEFIQGRKFIDAHLLPLTEPS